MIAKITAAAALLSLVHLSTAPAAPLTIAILDDGFEAYPLGPLPEGLPSAPAGIQGDPSDVVVSVTQGSDLISPHAGAQMLQFIHTYHSSNPNEGINSDLYYLLDISLYAASIADGTSMATISAFFNAGATGWHEDSNNDNFGEVDNAFFLGLFALEGSPADFPNAIRTLGPSLLDFEMNYTSPLITDRDPSTWESSEVTLTLPAGTTYIAGRISANENVHQNGSGDDFVSSFADSVGIELYLANGFIPNPVPESGSSLLFLSLAIAGLTVTRRRMRKAPYS